MIGVVRDGSTERRGETVCSRRISTDGGAGGALTRCSTRARRSSSLTVEVPEDVLVKRLAGAGFAATADGTRCRRFERCSALRRTAGAGADDDGEHCVCANGLDLHDSTRPLWSFNEGRQTFGRSMGTRRWNPWRPIWRLRCVSVNGGG